jgi:hypothetical protein
MSALAVAPEFLGEVHAYADRWPMSSPDDLQALADDIAANGLWHPIVLDPEGRLVDGRNRLAACDLAGIAPTFVVDDRLDSEDAIGAYIWAANGERRDMTRGQKAMLKALQPGGVRFLGKQGEVSSASIAKARQVIEWCDAETIDAVIAGTVTLNDAYATAQQIKATEQAEEIARKRAEADAKRKADEEARRLVDLRQARPDLAALVDAGNLALVDALTVRDKDLAAERREAEQRRGWLRKLRDSYSEALLGIDSFAHPNNAADTLAALAEFPMDPMFHATGPEAVRARAKKLAEFADLMEAQQ